MSAGSLLAVRNVGKSFGSVVALSDVSFDVMPSEVHCLLGDNGAGKSTLIKILSGVHQPSQGALFVDGEPAVFDSPREALDRGIATVFQDLAMIPLMSVARNFFLGREPIKRLGPIRMFDAEQAESVTRDEMSKMGIMLRDPRQPVGTLSGGERQCVAISRAVYFGAKVLILDEPTSALGVTQTAMVLQCIGEVRSRGLGVIFITHNVRHALQVGDRFTVLNRGRTLGFRTNAEATADELQSLMGGAVPA
ncbi:ATP-binding cassette domain-containing protein [Sphingomonas sp. RB56-2]|uniref:ATP-binding cassette domain-containing protein n=1 Tax=Sphingomonas brevis TaxID=2908206 RepID=A0ABT0S8Q9_9SPHN|nr:ATP-binding cassette domain-containing protein [Sphingomonas brevis]MCL6740801.1 ATP-binding cassette domain-containing protein [Sphingomonas brevis]